MPKPDPEPPATSAEAPPTLASVIVRTLCFLVVTGGAVYVLANAMHSGINGSVSKTTRGNDAIGGFDIIFIPLLAILLGWDLWDAWKTRRKHVRIELPEPPQPAPRKKHRSDPVE